MFDLFGRFGTQQLVEAHGKQWVTLYRVGDTSDHENEIWIALPAEAMGPPWPCSVIYVKQDAEHAARLRESDAKHQAAMEKIGKSP